MSESNIAANGRVDRSVRGGAYKHLTKKQRRMKKAVAWLTEYMRSYNKQSGYMDYEDKTFVDDVLYGLGVALHGTEVSYASGYEKWKKMLRDHLVEAPNKELTGTNDGRSEE